jgi:hypothetical protein
MSGPLPPASPTALRLLHHPVTFLHECRQLTREGNPPAPLPVDNLAHVKAQPLSRQNLEPSRAGHDSQPAVNCLVDKALENGGTC